MSNFKIFPAWITPQGQKVPLIDGWQEKASDDPVQIKAWQDYFKHRITLWGIPMGATNGIFALDVDIKTNGWQTIRDKGFEIPPTLSQKTLNGGAHFVFRFDPEKDTGNRVGFLPGLDIRSSGGWIAYYGFDNNPILDAPEWLYESVKIKKKPDAPVASNVRLAPEIARGIFDKSLDTVREAPAGESNNILNSEAFRIGQLLGSSDITREYAEQELFKAAKDRGKPDYEAKATIKSGLDGGIKAPLTCPFPATEPTAAFTLPEPPKEPERWTPKYLTRADLLNTSKLRKPQLFRDWSTEDIHITTADGGTGKTTLKLNEAICLALGDRFLGFENKQRGRTLFITGEDTDKKLAAMMGAIMNQMGILDGSPENEAKVECILQSIVIKKDADLCLIAKDRQGFLHMNRDAMNKLLQAIDDIKPKMIVFDPIASFWGSEAALNDMNKAVTKFMSELVDKSNACVEMINHMGKSSSANKDMSQFAGRGGSGLPSNSRVSRVLRPVGPEEFTEMTGSELVGDQSAILCNVNKFSDGSPLYNKPFLIIRNGYLFSRTDLSIVKQRELEKAQNDFERVFNFVKECHTAGKYVTKSVIMAHFQNHSDKIAPERVHRALSSLVMMGHMGEKLIEIANPDVTRRESAYIVADMDGNEKAEV